MDKIEYTHIDKSGWGAGAWNDEPDKVQWYDEATGLPCLIVRAHTTGALCGYVGVRPGHPWHGKGYDDVGLLPEKPEDYDENWYPDVHGGLTFAGPCREGAEETGICHIPREGDTDNVWWFGFDCAHAGDLSPAMEARLNEIMPDRKERYKDIAHIKGWRETYKDIDYVRKEVTGLAAQAAQMEEKTNG